MKQPQTLVKVHPDGTEEIWYSDAYIKEQIELAYMTGISAGIQVKFHAIEPKNLQSVIDYTTLFWNVVNEEYEKHFAEGRVWKIQNNHKIKFPIRG